MSSGGLVVARLGWDCMGSGGGNENGLSPHGKGRIA